MVKYHNSKEHKENQALKFEVITKGNSELYDNAAEIISSYTNLKPDNIKYFLENFGLDKILEDPSVMGANQEDESMLLELKAILNKI